jgi:hypothetical protein
VRLLHIDLDRSRPGEADTVRLIVEWANWEPHPPEPRSVIEFTDCYRVEAAMNFGILCAETFAGAWAEPDHPQIARIAAWSGLTDLFCWVFETNATASTIRIIARGVSIKPLP